MGLRNLAAGNFFLPFLDNIFYSKYNKTMNTLLEVNRVAFSIAGVDVYWYGIIITSGIIVAILVATLYCKLKKIRTDLPLTIALIILPTGILSARLFSVIFEPGLVLADFFNFRTGGLSIIGAIIGGGLGLLVYVLIKKQKNPFELFDVLCVVLLLAMAIGRWGNFFNTEVYGQLVDKSSSFAHFPFVIEKDGNLYEALFFYESCANLLGFAILSVIFFVSKRSGYTSAFMVIYYGTVRAVLEPRRQSQYILKLAGLPISQILSFAMIALGVAILIYLIVSSHKKKEQINGKKTG